MLRQILTGITLLAFVNCLMGCAVTSTEKVPGQGAYQITEKITELVLRDGTTVSFGKAGGRFVGERPGVRGRSPEGAQLFAPVDEAWQCRTSMPRFISPAELDTAHIREVVLLNNTLVRFDTPGASYNRATGKLTGINGLGMSVSYRLDALRSLRALGASLISVPELMGHPEQPVYEVVTTKGAVFTFDSTGGRFERVGGFFGADISGNQVSVPVDGVLYATVEKADPGLTILATLGIIVGVAGVIFLIALATKQSCPFIYAYDGQHYVFDAEPLGGAICPGLARTDISRLDHVKPVGGEYRLLVRNEVPETQYIDRMKMLVVDHAPGAAVYPDLQGHFYGFTNVREAISATDEKGMSLMKFLRASDRVAWQTHLSSASKEVGGPTRHQLTVTLPKPAGATRAWLVTNIGTSSWGSNMIRKTVEYRGNTAGAWLASVTPGSQSFSELYQFLEREEMYHLKTWVKEGASWKQEAVILGQGPLISEDRVYPMDVSNVAGDSLVLRFDPPKGFWTFDYIGVSYEEPAVMHAGCIDARRAEDQHGASLLGSLHAVDTGYYAMPEVGDWATVSFAAPAPAEGTVRSVYLQTTGYYTLHLPKDKPDQLARLYSLWMSPGQIVTTAMEEFRAWQAEQQTAWSQPQAQER